MGAILAMVIGVQVAAFASHPLFPLAGSNFEIDQDANLKVDDSSPSIDWLTGGEATGFRDGVDWKLDTASGANDESFTQGTKEDTADPVVETGSIPPNKSALKPFGLYEETVDSLSCSGHAFRTLPARQTWTSSSTRRSVRRTERTAPPPAKKLQCVPVMVLVHYKTTYSSPTTSPGAEPWRRSRSANGMARSGDRRRNSLTRLRLLAASTQAL